MPNRSEIFYYRGDRIFSQCAINRGTHLNVKNCVKLIKGVVLSFRVGGKNKYKLKKVKHIPPSFRHEIISSTYL